MKCFNVKVDLFVLPNIKKNELGFVVQNRNYFINVYTIFIISMDGKLMYFKNIYIIYTFSGLK